MIEVKGLTKKYGDRVAVDNISFNVQKGEVLGFLGQNGAGKSTTMKILTCFMSATSGTASVAGFDVFDNPLEVKRRIGYLPETPPLYMELLVGEYLEFAAHLRGVPKAQRKARIDSALEKCHLTEVRNRLIGNLSKGFKQRVGIAQAILHDPEVLVLDEPTIGLDPKQVTEARGLIQGLKKSHTVIYSTHILSEVAATCDRILIIDRGKIVAQEDLGMMTKSSQIQRTELLVRKTTPQMVQQLKALSGVKNVTSHENGANRLVVESESSDELMAEFAKVVVSNDGGLLRMSPVALALEDYYLGLIGGKRREV